MSIYTRRGDGGETSLSDGSRLRKDAARVEALGTLDEAGSAIGFARCVVSDAELQVALGFVQQRLMNCAAALATPDAGDSARSARDGAPAVTVAFDDVVVLERAIDAFTRRTGPFRGFVVETGSEGATRLHLARAIMRRAERRVVALAAEDKVPASVSAFVNRASDTLYAAARLANLIDDGVAEPWDPQTPRPY